jgi:hypothetical protein
MTEIPEPHPLHVRCYNAKDGCPNSVAYMGVTPVRKLCSNCLKHGTPTERMRAPGDLTRATRALRHVFVPDGGFQFESEAVYAVTVWPKTRHGGRVSSYGGAE